MGVPLRKTGNVIYNEDPKLLELLLIDRTKTTNEDVHNIMWATDNYAPMGQGYQEWDEINIERITGENGMLLRPRVNKSKAEQEYRSRDKADLFSALFRDFSENRPYSCVRG